MLTSHLDRCQRISSICGTFSLEIPIFGKSINASPSRYCTPHYRADLGQEMARGVFSQNYSIQARLLWRRISCHTSKRHPRISNVIKADVSGLGD